MAKGSGTALRASGALLAITLLALALPPTARAEDIAEVASLEVNGPGWAAFRVDVRDDGTRIVKRVRYEHEAGDFALSAACTIGGADFHVNCGSGYGRSGVGVHAEVGPTGTHVEDRYLTGDSGWRGGVGFGSALDAGTYTIVLASFYEGPGTSAFSLEAAPGVDVVATSSGSEVFGYRDVDFGGDVNVKADGFLAEPKTILNASVTEHASNEMLAVFIDLGCVGIICGTSLMSIDTPNGREDWRSSYSILGPPGEYRFNVDASLGEGPLWLIGADVTLP